MKRAKPVSLLMLFVACILGTVFCDAEQARPNVIIIYADDLGYGDVGVNGATKIQTPNIDKLAVQGRNFTDAHAAAATDTASRYALLTGQYAWRVGNWESLRAQDGLLIQPDMLTLPEIFQKAGYTTACIGKWQLGWGESVGPDWNDDLALGPLDVGFDYYFGVPVTNSQPPFVYVQNRKVVGLEADDPLVWKRRATNPNTQAHPGKKTQSVRDGYGFSGGKKAHSLYEDEIVGKLLSTNATAWISAHKDVPFFLYYATTAIHPPFTPHPDFQGTSEAGAYGDFVHELDWIVGEIMDTLNKNGLSENTIVIFTSDNGAALNSWSEDAMASGHHPNAELQGFKLGAWEGGHRVPFIMRWPGKIRAGSESSAFISSIDLMRTFAAMLDYKLPASAAPDSFDMMNDLVGHSRGRYELLMSPLRDTHLSLRQRNWVYIPAQGSGGLSNGLAGIRRTNNTNSDISPSGRFRTGIPEAQLYDLKRDPRQQINLIDEYPEVAAKLAARLKELRESERTAHTQEEDG